MGDQQNDDANQQNLSNGSELSSLRIEDWDAPAKNVGSFSRTQYSSETSSGCDSPTPGTPKRGVGGCTGDGRKRHTQLAYEEVIQMLDERIQVYTGQINICIAI